MKVHDGRVGCAGKEGNYTLQSQTLGWQLQRGVTKLELFENSNCLTCNAESDYATTNIARSPTPGRLILYWVLINVLSFYKCLLYKALYKLYHFQFISVANQIFSKVEICKLKRDVQRDFRPLVFSLIKPTWATDQQVKIFSNFG